MSDELIGTIAVFIVGLLANWWSNHSKIKELKLAQEKLEKQYDLDSKKLDSEISSTYLSIAQKSGDQVITRDNKIARLENDFEQLKKIVDGLILDKSRLENENINKDKRITCLEEENLKLSERIDLLEAILNEKGWPIPPNMA